MNSHHSISSGSKTIFRRDYQKRDGRDLLLYGYKPHNEHALVENVDELTKDGELRWHPLRNEWNLYAAHRQNRTFMPSVADDPLAPSTSNGTPTEIPFTDFELAVFENKFTSLHLDASLSTDNDYVKTRPSQGQCEVIVYTPESEGNLFSIGQDKRRLLLAAWIDRYSTLFSQGCEFVLPFENRGIEVGVTLDHPHGQIYGFPLVPEVQKKAAKSFADGYDLVEDLVKLTPDYAITMAGGLTAFCPPYARFPFEVWIAPQTFEPGPWTFSEQQLDGFAYLLGDICRRYDAYFERPTAYMLSLHAAPVGADDSFHFTAQFYPILRAPDRVKYLASVEQSTGIFTVDVMPENAAKILSTLNS